MRAGMPIAEDLRELSRTIVTKVARETASILHTRNDLGALDDPIDEAEFCDEAEALATGEECGCLEPDESIEGSLMVWVENSLRERVSASEERERVLTEALQRVCPMVYATRGEQLRLGLITHEEYRDMVRLRHSGIGAVETVCAALAIPAPAQPSICPDCRSAKPSSRGLLCDAGREWRCDNEWHEQPAQTSAEKAGE